MTLKRFALNYNRCSMAELRKFITQRTGHDPLKSNIKKTRRQCRKRWTAKLRRLDLNATFRLLALPPELQNIVYVFALTHDRDKGSGACPALLRASSKIHNDAVGILNANSVLELSIVFHRFVCHNVPSRWIELRQGGPAGRSESIRPDCDMAVHIRGLPSVQTIRLTLTLRQSSARGVNFLADDWSEVTAFLTELLPACPSLEDLAVQVDSDPGAGYWGVASWPHMLLPLAQLPSSCTLKLKGLSDQDYAEFWQLANAMDME